MKLVLGLLLASAASTLFAAPLLLEATVRGGLDADGTHGTGGSGTAGGNYIAGTFEGDAGSAVRNFFVFDLSAVGGTVTGATLQLQLPADDGYGSSDATETYSVFDFLLSPAILSTFPPGVAAYTDLGSGTSFGTVVLSAADQGTIINIVLNGSAIAAINAALGGSFAVGGANTTLSAGSGINEYVFGNSITLNGTTNTTHLLLEVDDSSAVPEPSSVILTMSGLMLLGLARKRGFRK